jgi:predicted ATPase/DNA-binding XRE family transcriptional regulator
MDSFGELLRRYRLAAGVSQETLAERARISAAAVGALERGARRAPYRETVALIVDGLGLSGADRSELEAAAERARGRPSRPAPADVATHNVPEQLTSFVGRDRETAEIKALLATHRLVTLTGSGGVGKTRIALELARQVLSAGREEVWFVDLSPLRDGSFVAGAVASALEISLAAVVDPLRSLAAALKTRKVLLILDNCEHVIDDAAAAVAAILRSCPAVAVLATSRERLAIEGEVVFRLPSLDAANALRLFVERATSTESRLVFTEERTAMATSICRQLEGMPLAIELAASRLPTLGFDGLNRRLEIHLAIESHARDIPQRQRTMIATIAWSYDLLDDDERKLLRRLSIFRGGATFDAVAEVCADASLEPGRILELLSFLFDKSLVSMIVSGEQDRYVMLEAVRTFAWTKLTEAGELTQMALAHASWLATVADRADDLNFELRPKEWLAEFGADFENARGALEWSLGTGDAENALLAGRIVGGLRGLWLITDRRAECRRWSERALAQIDADRDPFVAARAMRAHIQSAPASALVTTADRAIELFERVNDRRALIAIHATVAREYSFRGAFAAAEDALARAFELADAARMGRSRSYVNLLQTRLEVRAIAGRIDEARLDLGTIVELEDGIGEAWVPREFWEGCFAFAEGNVRSAAELLEACAATLRAQSKSPAYVLPHLAASRILLGELDAGARAAREALELSRFDGIELAWRPVLNAAAIAALERKPHRAARLLGFVDASSDERIRLPQILEHATRDVLTASLRQQLPEDVVERLAAEGAQLTADEAIDEALTL